MIHHGHHCAGRPRQKPGTPPTAHAARFVLTDGSVADGAGFGDKPMVGGFSIVEVDTPQEGLDWAARIAAAGRCA
ncbi:YciI family protein [Micropruina sonneratiae]|uniref:YciI family protein n=1 Tax=Micropruina sonneratiae TaxID=2986940 RepID=UPI002226657C|nr:YciI family protein [Micropruina sp. KQZ13P-5]